MSLGRWACITGMLGALLWPCTALPCSPWEPQWNSTIPVDGGTHPSNAAIIILGRAMDPEGLTATIDGAPVLVEVDPRSAARHFFVWGTYYETLALTLDPPPLPGQTVELFGELCPPEAEEVEPDLCVDFDLSWQASAPDLDAPAFDLDFWYDVYDHGSVGMFSTSCGSSSAQYELDLRLLIEAEAEAPLHFEAHRRLRDEPGQWELIRHQWRHATGVSGASFRLQYLLEEVIGWLPLAETFCFEIRTTDLAGNPGPSIERCPPCHDQVGGEDEGSFIGTYPETRPEYTEQSLYPEGYCPQSVLEEYEDATGSSGGSSDTDGADPDGGTSGGDDSLDPDPPGGSTTAGNGAGGNDGPYAPEVGSGCLCAAGRSSPAPAWSLLLGLFGLGALRRRR